MDSWIERIWNDTVLSKVVAGLLTTALIAGLTFLRKKIGAGLVSIWSRGKVAIPKAWAWLVAPVQLPRVLLLVVLLAMTAGLMALPIEHTDVKMLVASIAVGSIVWWLLAVDLERKRARSREFIDDQKKELLGSVNDAIEAARGEERAEADKRVAAARIEEQEAAEQRAVASKIVAEQKNDVDSGSQSILQALCAVYPYGSPISDLQLALGESYAATESRLDRLANKELVKVFRPNTYSKGSASWRLTTQGRDYCVKNGFDLLG